MKPNSIRLWAVWIAVLFTSAGCFQQEEKRKNSSRSGEQVDFDPYLTELEKVSTVLTVLQNVTAVPGILEQVPVVFSNSLKQTSNTLRYLSSPTIEKDGDMIKFIAAKMMVFPTSGDTEARRQQSQLQLEAWYHQEKSKIPPQLQKLVFLSGNANNPYHTVIMERAGIERNHINLGEILRLFPAEIADSVEPNFLAGLLSYQTNSSGFLEITAQDLVFELKKSHIHLSFSFSIIETTGSLVAATISGKVIDPQSKIVASEYEWDLARLAKIAVNFPFAISVPEGSQP